MDLLEDVLAISGVRGTVGARIVAGERWGVWWTGINGAALHAVTVGSVWITLPGRPPLQLGTGDVVLLPRGDDHSLASAPDSVIRPCDMVARYETEADGEVLFFGKGDTQTQMLSASYQYDPAVTTQLLNALPDVVHIRADCGDGLGDTVRLLARELGHAQPGTGVVLNRLVDILLVQVLRVWLSMTPIEADGYWRGVLGDAVIREALTRIHDDPARDWTTAMLATELGVSRATLSRRFPAIVGQSPGAYLTQWRMDLAAWRLRTTDDTLEAIASVVGYRSVYAFSRAFRRAYAAPPGQYRAAARSAERAKGQPRCNGYLVMHDRAEASAA